MKKDKIIILIILIVSVLLGLLTKKFSDTLPKFIYNQLGGTFYVLFWSFLAVFIFGIKKRISVCLIVLLFTILLEFSQLININFLIQIRKYFLIRTIIGSNFNWMDIPYYILGTALSVIGLKRIAKIENEKLKST